MTIEYTVLHGSQPKRVFFGLKILTRDALRHLSANMWSCAPFWGLTKANEPYGLHKLCGSYSPYISIAPTAVSNVNPTPHVGIINIIYVNRGFDKVIIVGTTHSLKHHCSNCLTPASQVSCEVVREFLPPSHTSQ